MTIDEVRERIDLMRELGVLALTDGGLTIQLGPPPPPPASHVADDAPRREPGLYSAVGRTPPDLRAIREGA